MEADSGADLAGLGVLIPRPVREPDRLVELLESTGCHPVVKPVLEIVPVADDVISIGFNHLVESADMVIFISGNAVNYCLAALNINHTSFSSSTDFFAVGKSTTEVLTACGYNAAYPEHRADSEGLLELPQLTAVAGKRILICRGKGGRETLGETLRKRGAEVNYLDLYQRLPITEHRASINDLIKNGQIRVVAIHSGEVLNGFLGCLDVDSKAKLKQLAILTPGQRVANLLSVMELHQQIVAPSAVPEKMVDALVDWYTAGKTEKTV